SEAPKFMCRGAPPITRAGTDATPAASASAMRARSFPRCTISTSNRAGSSAAAICLSASMQTLQPAWSMVAFCVMVECLLSFSRGSGQQGRRTRGRGRGVRLFSSGGGQAAPDGGGLLLLNLIMIVAIEAQVGVTEGGVHEGAVMRAG